MKRNQPKWTEFFEQFSKLFFMRFFITGLCWSIGVALPGYMFASFVCNPSSKCLEKVCQLRKTEVMPLHPPRSSFHPQHKRILSLDCCETNSGKCELMHSVAGCWDYPIDIYNQVVKPHFYKSINNDYNFYPSISRHTLLIWPHTRRDKLFVIICAKSTSGGRALGIPLNTKIWGR